MILTHDFDGPYRSGRYHLTNEFGQTRTIDGREAGLLALLLSGRKMKDGVPWSDVIEADTLPQPEQP